MFDIGFTELLLIGVVALIVLGPERLPKAARFAGLWVRRARAQWYSVKSELERDLAADELRRSVREAQESLHGIGETLEQTDAQLRHELDALRSDADALQREARQAAPSARPPHQDDAYAIALDPTRGTREDHAHSDQPGVATDVTTDDWHALMTEDTDPRAAAEPSAIADDWQADGTSVDTVHAPEPQQPEPARSAHETRPRGEPDRHANG